MPLKGFLLLLFSLPLPPSLPLSFCTFLFLSPTPSSMLLLENSQPISGSLGTVGIPYPNPWLGEIRRPHREKGERVEEKEKEMNE